MIGIYKITNKVNGKVYIGQSINIKQRWRDHKKDAFWRNGLCYNYPLYRAIRKYGIENFSFEVLEECEEIQLNEKEIYYISLYNATNVEIGYNQAAGGYDRTNHCKLSCDAVNKIIAKLKTSLDTTKVIAKEFGVSYSTIRDINVGKAYIQDNEMYPIRPPLRTLKSTKDGYSIKDYKYYCPVCGIQVSEQGNMCPICAKKQNAKVQNRPPALELAGLVKKYGFTEVGKQFNVSGKAVAKWCQSYGIPHKRKEVIKWYNSQMGIVEHQHVPTPIAEITKPVQQIDKRTGEVLATFKSLHAACKAVNGTNAAHISEACQSLRKSAYGYSWKYI